MLGKCAAIAALAIALQVSAPLRASAHAELLASHPADNTRLGLAPSAVVLDFSEPLYPSLSEGTVIDPSGHAVTAPPASATEIRVNLLTNLPGVYHVTWAAVSATDSHATHGAFTFTVEASSVAGARASSGPTLLDVILAVARWVEDASLLLATGMLGVVWLARRERSLAWVHPRLLPPVLVAFAAGIVVLGSEAVEAAGFNLRGVALYFAGAAGPPRLLRVLLEGMACVALAARWRAGWVLVPAALVALAASGHAAGGSAPWLGVTVDAGHLLAAAVWVGGILAMATLRPPGGWRVSGQALLRRFTPWALFGFTVSVGLGAVQAITNLGDAAALVTTAYGRVLLAKAVGVVAIIPFSALAWRQRRTHVRTEAVIGVAVTGVAALLLAFPVPARTVPIPAALAAASGLPRANDLTLGGQAGQTLVGLTISPARPGTNRVTISAIPSDGTGTTVREDVTAIIDGSRVALQPCGDTCRAASITLVGGERVSIRVAGAQGGTADFRLPALPAPSGSRLLTKALARMSALHSVALHETLTGGAGTTIITAYDEVAPDVLEWTQPNGSATIVIGSTRYIRPHLHDAWTVGVGNPTVPEPAFSWGLFSPYVSVHVLGDSVVGSVRTTVVGCFAGAAATPVWFRFYVDDNGLVRRADMSAPGHFMIQTFANFDGRMSIVPPVAG